MSIILLLDNKFLISFLILFITALNIDEDGINDDFIEASLFDDLSGNVAEAEKAFTFEENVLSLQEKLFNQSEINNAEDRKKKC